jgi:O-antigen/teichoic acid export membrane protein
LNLGFAIRRMRTLFSPVRAGRESAPAGDHAQEKLHRATQRIRRAVLTGSIVTLARVVQIGTSLVTIPLTLKYLGNERFGLWMSISSVLAMAAFADFGIGNGVLNSVAKAFGSGDGDSIRRTVASGFAVLSSIAAAILILFFSIYPFVAWDRVFRVTSPIARAEAGPAMAVFVVCFALNISMDVVQRVQLGLQQGYRYGMWQLSASAVALLGVLGGIWLHVSLPVLVIAFAGAPVFATSLNTVHFFGFLRPDLRPSLRLISREVISRIVRLGGLFFVLQLVASLASSADNFIIARMLGAVMVPEYSIPQRLFTTLSMMSGMLVSGLWPAYGEAIASGDLDWVRRTLKRSMWSVFLLSSVAAGVMLMLARTLLHLWVGSRINPPFVLLLGLALWMIMDCCGNAFAMFLNGASIMRFQIVVASVFGIGCVLTKLLFIRRFGIDAVPWATLLSYSALNALPYVLFAGSILRRLTLAHDIPIISEA